MPPRPYPDWSWSPSRHNLFEECRRKYYFHYYAAHNGWYLDAPPMARQAYRLKQMTNLYLIFGDAVHKMAEEAVKSYHHYGKIQEPEEIIKRIRFLLNQAYKDSKDIEAWTAQPKQRRMLHEMYYRGGLPPQLTETIKTRLPILVDRLLGSESLQHFMHADSCHLVELEKLNTLDLGDTMIYVKLDFMYRQAGRYIIVDWKTGQEDERNVTQLRLYSWYVHENYGIPYEQIDIRTEYLLSGQCKLDQVEEYEMNELAAYVETSIAKMRHYLSDTAANAPKSIMDFEVTDDERKCRRCSYREMCEGARPRTDEE
ncbi:PD-(D/E)XK nuclease family protein [Paenibacillus sp. ACRRX]|uniref:PD-(D/E)XK nuclease family protein n=1 Tax=Paenibacillus sp. ACRRX TaxID=2918206 RepID=UPI001EF70BA4|nr:PD-(D/E)XK nuclease family protein [Paenibacillus sp. ACRRX]MCG7408584.1 PD-(D/E)XK nuclease family protein [Paenibacillus sp. ACRRX]